MTWITYIFIVFSAFLLLIVILFLYYRRLNRKLFPATKSVVSEALPRLAGGVPAFDKMFQEGDFSKGSICFNVPIAMKTGKKYRIVSKVACSNKVLIKENETEIIHEIPVTELMSCKLSGEAFTILSINNELQKIFENDITEWQWDVTPQKGGIQNLLLLASIHVRVENERYLKDIPVFECPVIIQIDARYHIKRFFIKNWQWLIGTFIGSGLLWEVLKLKFENK